jgi:multiple sugar transport system substrate-binding protein
MFYNVDYFNVAGIKEAPKTWDDLEKVSELLIQAKKDGKLSETFMDPMSIIFDGVRVAPFIYSNGGNIVDENNNLVLDTPESREALEFYYSLVRNKYANIPQNQGSASIVSAFSEGKSAMIMSGTWAEAFLKESTPNLKYEKALIPYSKKPATMFLSVAYSVNSQSKNKDIAAKFVKFVSGEKGQKILIENEHALPTVKSLKSEFVKNYPDKKVFIEAMNYAIPWSWGAETIKLSTEIKLYGEMIAIDGKMDIEQMLKELNNEFNENK